MEPVTTINIDTKSLDDRILEIPVNSRNVTAYSAEYILIVLEEIEISISKHSKSIANHPTKLKGLPTTKTILGNTLFIPCCEFIKHELFREINSFFTLNHRIKAKNIHIDFVSGTLKIFPSEISEINLLYNNIRLHR